MAVWLTYDSPGYADHRGVDGDLCQEEKMAIKRSMLYTATA
jgi:hypothetical protein